MNNTWIIIQHVWFGVILPLVDTKGDITFAVTAFVRGKYKIGVLMISPVLANVFFICYVWWKSKFDRKREKIYSWIFVLLNIWPQYQVFKLILSIYRTKPQNDLEQKEKKLEIQVLSIEPWIEAIPQFFSTVCLFTDLYTKDSLNLTYVKEVFGSHTLGIPTQIMFPINIGISFIVSLHCIIAYLNNGPVKISPKHFPPLLFIAKLLYVVSSLTSKIVIVSSETYIAKTVFKTLHLEGYKIFIFMVIAHVVVPCLLVIAPLIRYLGLRRYMKMILRNPPLLVLPLVTDYVVGPVDGYGRCHSGRWCWFRCCCWMCCCCGACSFDHGNEVTIHKKMSFVKMLYTLLFLVPIYLQGIQFIQDFEAGSLEYYEYYVSYYSLITVPIGIVAFLMSLYLGKFSVLNVDQTLATATIE